MMNRRTITIELTQGEVRTIINALIFEDASLEDSYGSNSYLIKDIVSARNASIPKEET